MLKTLIENKIQSLPNYLFGGLSYLVSLTQERDVYGHIVPNYYISSEKQFLDSEKEFYKKGNFNLGLSHGITGALTVLSIESIATCVKGCSEQICIS